MIEACGQLALPEPDLKTRPPWAPGGLVRGQVEEVHGIECLWEVEGNGGFPVVPIHIVDLNPKDPKGFFWEDIRDLEPAAVAVAVVERVPSVICFTYVVHSVLRRFRPLQC